MNGDNRGRELILVINPGSTSTKVAIYEGERERSSVTIEHSAEELLKYEGINEQKDFRKAAIAEYMRVQGIQASDLDAVAARCGAIGPMESGAYIVNEKLVQGALNPVAPHSANLAPIIGYEICREAETGINAYVYDGVAGTGKPEAKYTICGIDDFDRPFFTHVLNSRAVSIEQAKRDGVKLEEATYIVAHMGGGMTVNLISGGRVLDFIGDDEGSFSPERSGGVPVRPLVKLCYSGKYTEKEMQKKLKGGGGLMAYLGTNDFREAEKKAAAGDEHAALIIDAMVLQTAKDIASLAAVVSGKVDKIILTGGIAYSEAFTSAVAGKTEFIAPVSIIPGTYEMEALALGILRVLRGEEGFNSL